MSGILFFIFASCHPLMLCPSARHFTLTEEFFALTCSSQLRCAGIGLVWEGNRLVVQRTGDLSQQHYILSNLTQSLVKRRWAPLDAQKVSPLTYITFHLVFIIMVLSIRLFRTILEYGLLHLKFRHLMRKICRKPSTGRK